MFIEENNFLLYKKIEFWKIKSVDLLVLICIYLFCICFLAPVDQRGQNKYKIRLRHYTGFCTLYYAVIKKYISIYDGVYSDTPSVSESSEYLNFYEILLAAVHKNSNIYI